MTSSRSKVPNHGISGVAIGIENRFPRPDIKYRKQADTGADEESADDDTPFPFILINTQRRLALDFKANAM